MYQSQRKPPVGWTLERKYKNSPHSATYAQTARRKDRKKVLQFHLKQKHSRDINTIVHRTLRIASYALTWKFKQRSLLVMLSRTNGRKKKSIYAPCESSNLLPILIYSTKYFPRHLSKRSVQMEVRRASKTKPANGDEEDCDSNRMKVRGKIRGGSALLIHWHQDNVIHA